METNLEIRSLLSSELAERKNRNGQYSLRAFAKWLDVDASLLAKVIAGKRPLTTPLAHKISSKLALDVDQKSQLFDAIQLGRSAGRKPRKVSSYEDVSQEIFTVISEWYHYGIIELVETSGFCEDHEWIARRLGVDKDVVVSALARLEKLGFLKRDMFGQLVKAADGFSSAKQYDCGDAKRKLQSSILTQANEALYDIPFELRDQSSITMAISKSKMAEAKERIKRFRRELCDALQQDGEMDEVYQLSISFFPATIEDES